MEMNLSQPTLMTDRDASRNKFATSSFVLSLVSLLLTPLLIFQILGIVFGVKGLKSEKKGFSIAGIIISSVSILFAILAFIAFSMFSGVVNNAKQNADVKVSQEIQTAIVSYISQTGDFDMTFGENEKPTVETIITKLQYKTEFNGITVEPLLNNVDSTKTFRPVAVKNKGWIIKIDKSAKTVTVEASAKEDTLEITD